MTTTPASSLPPALPSHWLWPVPPWRGYQPTISSPWGTPRRRLDGTRRTHLGVDIMYRRQSSADQRVTFPPHTASGSADFFMPDDVPALAVDVGTVAKSELGPRGHSLILRHAGGWRTFYQHLVAPRVKVGDRVLPGQVLGTVGGDPTQTPPLRHLHFEVWSGPSQEHAVDPERSMERQWRIAKAAPAPTPPSPTTTPGDLVAMTYYHDDTDNLSNASAFVSAMKPGTTSHKPGTSSSRPPPQRHHPPGTTRPTSEVQWVPASGGRPGHWERVRPGTTPAPAPAPQYPAPAYPPQYPPPQYPAPAYPPPYPAPQPYPPPQYPAPPVYPPPMPYPTPYPAPDPYGYDAGYGYPAGGVIYVDEYGNPLPGPTPYFDPTAFGWPAW
jgi:hypothetical protein